MIEYLCWEVAIKSLKTLIPYLRKYSYQLSLGFVFIVLQNYGYVQVPKYMKKILNEISGANNPQAILKYAVFALFYTLFTALSMFLMRKLIIGVSRKIEYSLRKDLYNKLLKLDIDFFLKNKTGDLTSRCTNDLNDVRTLLGPGLMYVPNSITRFLMFLPVLLSLNKILMYYISAVLIILITIILIAMPRLKPLFKKIQEVTGEVSASAWQIISGITSIKLNTLEDVETKRFEKLNRKYINANMKLVKWRGFLWPFFIFILSISELTVLYFGGKQIIAEKMTIGELLQFNMMIAYLSFPVLSLGWILSLIQQGISAMGRINYILDAKEPNIKNLKKLNKDQITIEVKNLSYKYPASDLEVLKNISFTINPGETLGITGTVGSGKSTLAGIIAGLLKPPKGQVFLNGTDITEIEPASIFRKTAVVPQEPFLFSRSIKKNIALGVEISNSKIEQIAKTSGLENDIKRFQNKYDEFVGENGITLSGGQVQRTAIARALIKNGQVIIFDDALSSVDAKTENIILENLKNYLKNEGNEKSFILISHRISALKQTDRIIVLDKGKIVQIGTHETLKAEKGLYRKLALLQQLKEVS
jgi:ATP-binding cassette subfamily B protein